MVLDRYKEMYEDFECYFPGAAELMVDWYPSGRTELTICLSDRTRLVYDYINKTARQLSGSMDDDGYVDLPEMEWRLEFGKRLNRKMIDAGLTQQDLSDLTGITRLSINKYITGKSIPSLYNAQKLARALECSPSDLTHFQ